MARPANPIEDTTSLTGARIDVAARIGWFLRASRIGRGVSLQQMSDGLGALGHAASVPSLSNIERQGVREGRLMDRYERVLGLPDGHLRAPVDVLCRTFGYAPEDRGGPPEPVALPGVDAAWAPVLAGTATGGQWLRWARVLRGFESAAAPSAVVGPLVDRLVHELVRSVGLAYVTRYEAVAQLRTAAYADVVEDAVRGLVADEGSHSVCVNAMSAVSERPTPRLLRWCASLLEHESPWLVAAALSALDNMREVGGLTETDWEALDRPFLRAQAVCRDPVTAERLTALLPALSHEQRLRISAQVTRPLQPMTQAVAVEPRRLRPHYLRCERLAAEVSRAADLGDQPMVARLLFEVLHDHRGTRTTTSAWLLMASPVVDPLQERLLALAEDPEDDPAARRGALRALRHLQVPRGEAAVREWLYRNAAWDDADALSVAGNAGVRVPDGLARVKAAGERQAPVVVEVLGMSGHDDLDLVADDPGLPAGARAAAAWWRRVGARVVD